MAEQFGSGILYEEGSTKYAFDEREFEDFDKYLKRWYPGFEFDPQWIASLRCQNGGRPERPEFDTAKGRTRCLDYVYYFAKPKKISEDSSVPRIHTLASESDAFDYLCIPFGRLFGGDLICFDHRENLGGPAPVVIWLHEESEEDAPIFEYVAPTFSDFVPMLYGLAGRQ